MATIPEQYQILQTILETPSTSIYKCEDLSEGRTVALRVFHTTDYGVRQSAEYQYHFLRNVDHMHIIKVLNMGCTAEGLSYLVTEWAQDGNLSGKSNTLDLMEKQKVARQIAEALDFLHSLGYLHGDIKPSNVLFFRDNGGGIKIKLSDFEFLRSGNYVSPASWQGTPAYMAPEVLRGEPVSLSSDLYSFGILLFEPLTGRLPFEENNIYGLAYAQLHRQVEFNEQERRLLPEQLISLVQSLLQKDPTERIESAWRVRDALIEDDNRAKEADRRLGHSLIKYFSNIIEAQGISTPIVSACLNEIFAGLTYSEKVASFLLNKSGGKSELMKLYLCELIDADLIVRNNGRWLISEIDKFTLSQQAALKYLPYDVLLIPPESRKILESVSIFRYAAPLDILRLITNLTPEDFESNLDSLLKSGWLTLEQNNGQNRIKYLKGTDRDFILQEIDKQLEGELRRLAINRLQLILSLDYEHTLKELLHQTEKVGDPVLAYRYAYLLSELYSKKGSVDETLGYMLLALKHSGVESEEKSGLLLSAATIYEEKGMPKEALDFYLQYLASNAKESSMRADVERKVGWGFARLSDYEKARNYLNSASERFTNLGLKQGQISTLLDIAATEHMHRDYKGCENALKICENMVRENHESEEEARLLNLKGILDWSRGDYKYAFAHYRSSYEIYEKLEKNRELGRVANNLGLLLRDLGRYEEALPYLQKGLDIAQKVDDQLTICSSGNNLSIVYKALKRFDEGIRIAKMSLELAIKLSNKEHEGLAHNNLGFLYLANGNFDLALHHLRQAASVFKSIGNPSGIAFAYFNIGEIYRVRELTDLSRECYLFSLDIRRRLGEKLGMADCLTGLARLYLGSAVLEESKIYLPEALSLYESLGKQEEAMLLRLSLAEAHCNLKQADHAIAIIENYIGHEKSLQGPAIEPFLHLTRGVVEASQGDLDSAEIQLMAALRGLKSNQDKVAQARVCYYLGEIYLSQGKTGLAYKIWRESLRLYQGLRVDPKIKVLEQLMNESERRGKDKEQVYTLAKVSQLLSQIEDEDELLYEVLRVAIDLLGAERGAIIFYDEIRSTFEVGVSFGLEQETGRDALNISRRIIKEVQYTGNTFISGDAPSEPSLKDHQSIRMHNILSIVCTPLRINDKVIGTIYLDNRTLTEAFSEDDLDFIKVLTNLIALAISKSRNYRRVVEQNYLLEQRAAKFYDFPDIIGRSPAMQEVFRMVAKVAPTKATVLIQGESGTGKELIANLIHNLSDRKDKPFVRVNCAAIPDSLLESELFGVEEKVATGVTSRDGKFKQADCGTILLDEVADMNLTTQAKVLRVLQEREFERVGGHKTIRVDIRVISATNKDLGLLMKESLFRHDLYYRLNTITIPVSSLRDRKEDIPYLIHYFLERFCADNDKSKLRIEQSVIEALCKYDWPGNVRELMNVIERGVIFAEDDEFAYGQLPIQVTKDLAGLSITKTKGKLRHILTDVEKRIISETLKQSNWHQAQAARLLGIPESTLVRKMSIYKIKRPRTL